MPKTIKTIAIPAFGNHTTRYKLPRPAARPTSPANSSRARATRSSPTRARPTPCSPAAVINFVALPHHFRPGLRTRHGRAGGRHVQLTLTERATGKVLFTRPGAEFRERYEISIDPQAYFDESGTAMERLSQRRGPQHRHRHPGEFLTTPAQLLARVSSGTICRRPCCCSVRKPTNAAASRRRCSPPFPRTPSAQHDLAEADAGRNPGRRARALAVRLRAPDLGGQRGGRASPRPCRGR